MAVQIQPHRQLHTPAEYLALERSAEFKSEYIHGEISAMAGATFPHNRISSDVGTALNNQLADRPCDVLLSDMKVKVDALQIRYTYPDVVALCEEPRFEDAEQDVLLNPTVIIEILSPS